MGDIQQWFSSLPPMTRTWFGGTIALSLLGRFNMPSPYWLILDYGAVVHGFQIWRLVTCVFFYSVQRGFHFLITLYFLYSYSLRLETGLFARRPADYLFMLLFVWICCLIVGLLGGMYMLMDPMVMAVLYVWCQLNKDTIVSFWFGTQFKAMYLPWILFAFNVIMGNGGMVDLSGILIGHLYFFLTFKYPQDFGGVSLLQTPHILYKYFPNTQGGESGFGRPPPAQRAGGNDGTGGGGGGGGGGAGGFFRGQGHTLR
ncbi:derlin-1-like [Penaeus japonicus]|uniref:derlin-1-like n=1 Tax=Penaeus japonicus TaxID=27405 RepID=UPI001C7123A8|nr:derlin-1-like [Penaeus japonicus]